MARSFTHCALKYEWRKTYSNQHTLYIGSANDEQWFGAAVIWEAAPNHEPWHWRFVGVALATRLHNENKSFYDLTQREIDAYLVSIFD